MHVTIPLGTGLLVLLYFLLYRFTPLSAKQTGLVVSLLCLALYAPLVIIWWPGVDVLAMNVAAFFLAIYVVAIFADHRERVRLQQQHQLKWFHWGPAVIVVFFVVILLMDAVFVTVSKEGLPTAVYNVFSPRDETASSKTAFPGTIYNNYQKKESLYNRYLQQQAAIRERGWQVRKGWSQQTPAAGQPGTFQLAIMDADGHAITGLTATGRFMRPSDSRLDQAFKMQADEAGMLRARVTLPEPGLWTLHVNVDDGEQQFEIMGSTQIPQAQQTP